MCIRGDKMHKLITSFNHLYLGWYVPPQGHLICFLLNQLTTSRQPPSTATAQHRKFHRKLFCHAQRKPMRYPLRAKFKHTSESCPQRCRLSVSKTLMSADFDASAKVAAFIGMPNRIPRRTRLGDVKKSLTRSVLVPPPSSTVFFVFLLVARRDATEASSQNCNMSYETSTVSVSNDAVVKKSFMHSYR